MKPFTVEEIKEIVEREKIDFTSVKNPRFVDDMSPELREAIKDTKGLEEYLKKHV